MWAEAVQVPVCAMSLKDRTPVQHSYFVTYGRTTPTPELRCIHQCIEILGYTLKRHYMCSADASYSPHPGAGRLLCITFKILRALSICLNYCGCSKLLKIWPLTPLRCEGCPHRSALWLSPVLFVPRITSTVKCRLAEPFLLQWLLKWLLEQQNKITSSTHSSSSWYVKLYQS